MRHASWNRRLGPMLGRETPHPMDESRRASSGVVELDEGSRREEVFIRTWLTKEWN